MRKYLKKLKKEIFFRLFFHFTYIASIAGLPFVIKYMIDSDYENGIWDVIRYSSIFILFIVLGMTSQYITQINAWKLDKKLYTYIRQDLFAVILRKEPDSFVQKDIGEYNSMLNNDVQACEEYVEYYMQIFESIIGLIVYAAYIFTLNYVIAIVIYLVAILTLFLPNLTGSKFSEKKNYLLYKTGNYYGKVIDLLKGYPLVNRDTFAYIEKRHHLSLVDMEDSRYKYGKFKTFVNVLNGSVMYIVHIASFGIVSFLLFKGYIKVGVATATIAYIQNFMYPLRSIVDSISSLKSVKDVTKAVMLETDKLADFKVSNVKFKDKIEFERVSFAYDKEILKDFSYVFEKGKKYAILGESGKGKSTILNLLTGRIVPKSGCIKVDGKLVSYRNSCEMMMYLTQNFIVFTENFMDNISVYGSFGNNFNFEFISKYIPREKLRKLIDTSDCSTLSGGEKQLLSLIRAILSGKDILLFDEPFSALDKKIEVEVSKNILNMRDKTIIMVTHNEDKDFLRLFDCIIYL